MKLKLKLDANAIRTAYGLGPSNRARLELARQVRRRCDKYVPYDTGQLKNTAAISPDGRYLTYSQPYAHDQYYKNYRHSDPLRGPRWEKRMLANEKGPLLSEFERALKGGRS